MQLYILCILTINNKNKFWFIILENNKLSFYLITEIDIRKLFLYEEIEKVQPKL